MSKAQHTPETWSIWKNGQTIDAPRSPDGTRNIVAVVQGDTAEEQSSRASLIAAAPETAAERDKLREDNRELLEALEAILRMDVKGHELQDRLQFSSSGRAIYEKARAAIAKAKGE